MTPREARLKLRSLLYRRKLTERLPELEAELMAFLEAEGPQVLDGYRVEVLDGRLIVEELPQISAQQLPLPFFDRTDDGRRFHREGTRETESPV